VCVIVYVIKKPQYRGGQSSSMDCSAMRKTVLVHKQSYMMCWLQTLDPLNFNGHVH
jgi:hypothetical protein